MRNKSYSEYREELRIAGYSLSGRWASCEKLKECAFYLFNHSIKPSVIVAVKEDMVVCTYTENLL